MSLLNPLSNFGANSASVNRLSSPSPGSQAPPSSPSQGSGTGSGSLGSAPLSGDLQSASSQMLQMVMMLVKELMQQLRGGNPAEAKSGGSNPQQQAVPLSKDYPGAGGSGSGTSGQPSSPSAAGQPSSSDAGGKTSSLDAGGQPSSSDAGGKTSGSDAGGQPSGSDAAGQPSGSDTAGQPSGSDAGGKAPDSGAGGKTSNSGSGDGWNKNVSVMASSSADKETIDTYSGGNLVGGYLHDLEKGMDSNKNIDQANAAAQGENKDGAKSANVNPNSLEKGKGGNAIVATGDGYGNEQDADQLADKLKKNYGMNVQVLHNASPNKLKDAMQQMGQQNGQQCMVAVLAHGAKDDSGKNDGNIALGKGDGDQWLHENDLKSWANQYLSSSYGNVNVLLNSCYSGNFV